MDIHPSPTFKASFTTYLCGIEQSEIPDRFVVMIKLSEFTGSGHSPSFVSL